MGRFTHYQERLSKLHESFERPILDYGLTHGTPWNRSASLPGIVTDSSSARIVDDVVMGALDGTSPLMGVETAGGIMTKLIECNTISEFSCVSQFGQGARLLPDVTSVVPSCGRACAVMLVARVTSLTRSICAAVTFNACAESKK